MIAPPFALDAHSARLLDGYMAIWNAAAVLCVGLTFRSDEPWEEGDGEYALRIGAAVPKWVHPEDRSSYLDAVGRKHGLPRPRLVRVEG